MSFADLVSSSVSRKQEKIIVKHKGKDLTFFANELNMTQRIKLAAIDKEGGDTFTHWLVFSITDENGDRMTYDQAAGLPKEIYDKFTVAASKVNQNPKDKKKPTRKKN